MRSLAELVETTDGLTFLESEGVHVTRQPFLDRLEPPVRSGLASYLGAEQSKLVCSGQQVYVDYSQSVLKKVETLRAIADDESLFPFFLWVDTDRAGADNLATKFAWPKPSKKGAVTVLTPGTRDVELRFAGVDDSVLRGAIDKLGTSMRQTDITVLGAKERYETMRQLFADNDLRSLARFNLQLSNFLFTEVYRYAPPPLLLSEYLDEAVIAEEVDAFLNRLPDVIATFNGAVSSLQRQDVDPQVKPLPDDYLPLYYSCDADDRRLRLSHRADSDGHYAAADCKCGARYRFDLGTERLSVSELAATRRWSLDVCFPMFFNDLVSGFVAGKSSTLYLIVMNYVLRDVFDKSPVPILATMDADIPDERPDDIDSLIFRYLAGAG